MEEPTKSLKAASINEIEAVIAEALSRFTKFAPEVDVRAFETVKVDGPDAIGFDTYRFELKVKVPLYQRSDRDLNDTDVVF
ncbi:hypothetical protein [Stenotrophomonas sp. 24(2023)]|uniref:hypothetical protein n=1 Tax=Stenotrophomonas sp. 24(2023) TaxID=3068324 RepID=UPI0027E00D8B|nr:hypothetical protein [Stenotrophomonas sp. 24(2023)]WMJ68825.1 hypothetical protein Q9R17_16810 [Stenotrophomonas sp. 24(2023)]